MTAEQLRDYLAEHCVYRFPDNPVWLAIEGRVYEIGLLRARKRSCPAAGGRQQGKEKRDDTGYRHWHG